MHHLTSHSQKHDIFKKINVFNDFKLEYYIKLIEFSVKNDVLIDYTEKINGIMSGDIRGYPIKTLFHRQGKTYTRYCLT